MVLAGFVLYKDFVRIKGLSAFEVDCEWTKSSVHVAIVSSYDCSIFFNEEYFLLKEERGEIVEAKCWVSLSHFLVTQLMGSIIIQKTYVECIFGVYNNFENPLMTVQSG